LGVQIGAQRELALIGRDSPQRDLIGLLDLQELREDELQALHGGYLFLTASFKHQKFIL
jgi:hypothetical protein